MARDLARSVWKEQSDRLFKLSLWIDRELEGLHSGYQEFQKFDQYLKRTPNIDRLRDFVTQFVGHTEVIAVNLTTGLGGNDVHINWNRNDFVGLKCVEDRNAGAKPSEAEREDSERFLFERLRNPNTRLELTAHGASDSSRFRLLAANADLLGQWAGFLETCYRKTEQHNPIDMGRRFFNDHQARLNAAPQISGDALQASALTLDLVKTNFAYEVCTNYVWDGQRSIVVDPGTGVQDKEVCEHYANLRKTLVDMSSHGDFDIVLHGANSIGVHVNLITYYDSKWQLVLTRRGSRQTADTGEWQTSASGVTCPRASSIEWGGDIGGYVYDVQPSTEPPSLFRAAQRETFEELGVFVPPENIRIIGLLRHVRSAQPVLVAEAYCSMPVEEIRNAAKAAEEKWEVDDIQAVEMSSENLNRLFSGRELRLGAGRVLPPIDPVGATNVTSENRWQERSQFAVALSFLRHA